MAMKSAPPPPAPEPVNSVPSQLTTWPVMTLVESSVASPHSPVAEPPRAKRAKAGMINMTAASQRGMARFVLSLIPAVGTVITSGSPAASAAVTSAGTGERVTGPEGAGAGAGGEALGGGRVQVRRSPLSPRLLPRAQPRRVALPDPPPRVEIRPPTRPRPRLPAPRRPSSLSRRHGQQPSVGRWTRGCRGPQRRRSGHSRRGRLSFGGRLLFSGLLIGRLLLGRLTRRCLLEGDRLDQIRHQGIEIFR